MYDIEGGDGSDTSIVDDKGELATSISKIIQLRKQTITELNAKLGDKKSYGEVQLIHALIHTWVLFTT